MIHGDQRKEGQVAQFHPGDARHIHRLAVSGGRAHHRRYLEFLMARPLDPEKENLALREMIDRGFHWFMNGRYIQWAFGDNPKDERLFICVDDAVDAAIVIVLSELEGNGGPQDR